MTKSEWFDLLHDHWDDLKALVMSCHPRADYQLREDMPITAPAAEQACETVRRQLSAAGEPVTEQLLRSLRTAATLTGCIRCCPALGLAFPVNQLLAHTGLWCFVQFAGRSTEDPPEEENGV